VKFVFYNDTGRMVYVHPATFIHGCKGNETPIQLLEVREFELPVKTYPWVKMWDHDEKGLCILVSPIKEE